MPLTSIRVLDLTRLLPGPYCTMMLADFGAEVIKVEDPKAGDYAREREPKMDEDSAFFHALNRNKKSICLNLKTEEGKDSFKKLVEKADVVIESFRPGVMKRLGLDYETLKKLNPGIIYCAITGYGQTGPYKHRPGHDINYISYAGLLELMGRRDEKPIVPAAQIGDIGGGAMPATIGILLALFERQKSGKGQFVDISMTDGVLSWLSTLFSEFSTNSIKPKRGEGVLSGGLASYEVYQTMDGRFISVGALEPKFWQAFCTTIDREDLIPKLTVAQNEQDEMKREIQAIISEKTLDEWMSVFSGVDACVAPVLTFDEVLNNPQVQARGMIGFSEHSDSRDGEQIGVPIKLSETPGQFHSQPPKWGEHTEAILKTWMEEDAHD